MVGSGTVVPEGDRGASCYFVELDGLRTLLDCGPGAVQGLARWGLPWESLDALLITHFHGDHVGALPGLLFSLKHGVMPARDRPLRVLGPPGTRRLLEGLAGALGGYVLDPGFPIEVGEVEPGQEVDLSAELRLRARKTPHTEESLAYRLEGSRASVGYTGDTGPDPGLGEFMEGVDLLACECSLADEEVGDNHLSPSRAAAVARRARPGLLLLTHVYPHVREAHDVPALVAAAGYAGPTELARDGAGYPLPVSLP